jgi:hypothetical protein
MASIAGSPNPSKSDGNSTSAAPAKFDSNSSSDSHGEPEFGHDLLRGRPRGAAEAAHAQGNVGALADVGLPGAEHPVDVLVGEVTEGQHVGPAGGLGTVPAAGVVGAQRGRQRFAASPRMPADEVIAGALGDAEQRVGAPERPAVEHPAAYPAFRRELGGAQFVPQVVHDRAARAVGAQKGAGGDGRDQGICSMGPRRPAHPDRLRP